MKMRFLIFLMVCLLTSIIVFADTELNTAISQGNVELVTKILNKTSKLIESKNEDGNTLLHLACLPTEKDTTLVVQKLVDDGALINEKNVYGVTPIYYAAYYNKEKIVKFLIDKGADLKITDNAGSTFLHAAAKSANPNIVEIGLQSIDANVLDINRCSPLHFLYGRTARRVNNNKIATIDNFEQYNIGDCLNVVDLTIPDIIEDKINSILSQMGFIERSLLGDTLTKPLRDILNEIKLRQNNIYRCTVLLVEKGAKVNEVNIDGVTPAIGAAGCGAFDAVNYLVSKGADLKICAKNGETVLHAAASQRSKELIPFLLKNKCDVNIAMEDGRTPLHIAAYTINKDAVNLLLKAKSNANAINKINRIPLHEVTMWDTPRALEITKALLKKMNKKSINIQDKNGETPLHIAVYQSRCFMVELLLKNKADKNLVNAKGETPIDIARKLNNPNNLISPEKKKVIELLTK